MNEHTTLRFARYFALGAGLADSATGLGLLGAPALTLRAMGVAAPTGEALVYLQFVGTFVGAVGASYLLALASRRTDRLWAVFRVTTLFRFAAGSFVLVMVATGKLEWPWLSVTVTDATIAGVQLWLLPREPRR
jgi:hypothetical protein